MVFGMFGGKAVEISVALDRADGTYPVGDTVRAQIVLANAKGSKVREVRAGLVRQHQIRTIQRQRNSNGSYSNTYVWQTKETWITREVLASEGALTADDTYHVAWQIPEGEPATYAGDNIAVKWLAKVTVDRAMARDQNEELEFFVVAPPTGAYSQSGEFGEMNTASGVVMRLALPTLELVEGQTLHGQLLVEPSEPIDARELRVELVRDERVNIGDQAYNQQKSVERVQVAGSTQLRPGFPVTFDFALPVPQMGAPSHDLGDTVVTWMVVGTIDRPMRGDYTVSQWVSLHNG